MGLSGIDGIAAPVTAVTVSGVAQDATLTASVGAAADAEATGNGTAIGLLKRLRTLLNGGLPAALGAAGGLKVDGSGTALPVSSSTLATAAKQPALGTAGTPSADVISVQGIASGTALPVTASAPTAANILNGYLEFFSTTGASTLITIPAGRTWVGTVGMTASVAVAAASATAGAVSAALTTAGTNVTPSASTYLKVWALAGANAATGTVGSNGRQAASMPMTVVAPAGNAVTLQVATNCTGTSAAVNAYASGQLI